MNTTYYAPTKLFIGEYENSIGKIIKSYGYSKILFVYGKNSIKKTGLYDKIIKSLELNEITYYEACGVEPNPSLDFVRKVLEKKYDFEFILAVGGGSVIDTAKSISVSYLNSYDPWEYSINQRKINNAVAIGVIPTIAAAGSEMSNSCVISNKEERIKQGFNSDLIRPLFAIMNPKLTYSVSKYQTACGIVDIMMHTLERFIHNDEGDLADNFSIGLLKTVYKYGLIAYNEPKNYEARKNLLLASSFSHNGLTNIGRSLYFRAHKFEHIISGMFDSVAHGAGLAVVWIAYAKFIYKNPLVFNKFLRLSYEVFGIDKTEHEEIDAYNGIIKLRYFFKQLGMPLSLDDLGIDKSNLEEMTLRLTSNKEKLVDDIIEIDYDVAKKIFELMW